MTGYIKEVCSKQFTDKVSKNAYLKACKWLTKVVSQKEINEHVTYNIVKTYDNYGLPTFVVTIYAVANEKELEDRHCNICKEIHNSFLMHERVTCAECKLKAFQRRIDTEVDAIRSCMKEKIDAI